MYRSPSQSDELEYFAGNIVLNFDSIALKNPYLIADNAKAKGWHPLNKTIYKDTRIYGITSQFGLE